MMITGMNPYLVTNGNGQEAVKFYEEVLGAKVQSLQTFGDMPDNPEYPTPPEAKDRILHAHMKVGDFDLLLSDTFPTTEQPYQLGEQVSIALIIDDAEQTRTIFDKLADGGTVGMPLQETFWSPLYGNVTDKFGVTWQISTEAKESS